MRSRTCPSCKYTYSLKEYLKKPFWEGVFSKWDCLNCGRKLTISTSRRFILAVLGAAPAVLTPYIAEFLMTADFSPVWSWIGAVFLVLVWAIGVFSFEVFILNEEPRKEDKNQ